MPDSYADYYRALAYRNSPEYAWQQQLASGANLAKNLNWQTLLGLNLGTILGSRLGNIVGNWQQENAVIQHRINQLIDKGYSDVTYDKATRRFTGLDANGNTIYFGRNGEIIPQQPSSNYNPQSPLWQRGGDFNLGWTPQQEKYPFKTPIPLWKDRMTPNIDWQQNNRRPQPFFPMTPTTPRVFATPTQPAPTPTSTVTEKPIVFDFSSPQPQISNPFGGTQNPYASKINPTLYNYNPLGR